MRRFVRWCPRKESNLGFKIRNLVSYPLNDEGIYRYAFPIVYNSPKNTSPFSNVAIFTYR